MGVLYSPLKAFAFGDRLRDRSDGTLHAPVHVRIKPTNACNQNCWFCAYRVDNLQLGANMDVRDRIPREKMFEIVDDLAEMGVRAVTFSGGGEPSVYPYLAETVRRLGNAGIKIGCLTNGSALRGEVAGALAAHAVWVRVSIDGWDAESYARSRRVRADIFQRVLENIRAFAAAAPRCTTGISFIVTRENADHIFEFCRLAKSLGIQHVKLSPCIVGNEPAENNRYHEPIHACVTEQIARCERLKAPGFAILDHYHRLPELFERQYDHCPMLRFLTVIGADLNVYTCQDKAYNASGLLGSIRDRRFRDFWHSLQNAHNVRSLDPRSACKHHCVSHGKNVLLTEFEALEPDHAAFV